MNWATGPLAAAFAVFGICTLVILIAGVKITRLADTLGKRTGLGSALFGAVLLGGTTSLPGIITSVSTAWQGYPELATSNAVGGIAAQTVFLIFADVLYRRANLEHAAASLENLVQATLLISLLAVALVGISGPDWTLWSVHPVTLVLLAAYCFGLRLINDSHEQPYWRPTRTRDTDSESDIPVSNAPLSRLWLRFAFFGTLIAVAGYGIGESGIRIAHLTGISQSVVGTLLTSIATSLPELVTVLSAVKMGALTLAVGDIIGGNSFDLLFLAFSDVAYREGSIYHAAGKDTILLLSANLLMNAVLLLGLLRRKRSGIGNIGFEGVIILFLYFWTVVVIAS